MSFLFLRSWLALCLLSIRLCSFRCFLVKAVTDTLPERQVKKRIYLLEKQSQKKSKEDPEEEVLNINEGAPSNAAMDIEQTS